MANKSLALYMTWCRCFHLFFLFFMHIEDSQIHLFHCHITYFTCFHLCKSYDNYARWRDPLLFFISIYTANCLKAWDTFFASHDKHKLWINYEAMQLFSCFLMLSDYSRANAMFLNITPSNNNGDGDNLFTCKISGSRSIDLTLKPYLLLKCSS